MKIRRRRFLLGALGAAGAAAAGGGAMFLHGPQFGRPPSAERLRRIQASPNWKNGAFRNLEPIVAPPPEKRERRLKIWSRFLFADKKDLFPDGMLPIRIPDFTGGGRSAEPDGARAAWLGHSSLWLELDGMRILVDPVFGDYASPVPFINRAFPGTGVAEAEDFPEIDVLAISHDHWDHLDYPSVTALRDKVRAVVCPLGVGEYLEQWGFDGAIIREGDWFDSFDFGGALRIHIVPGRHFSGRLSRSGQTLWGGFVFDSPLHRVYFSGDGGWGRHFAEIGRRFAPVDVAFMENGQYNDSWPSVHMTPAETALAAETVGARAVVPIHNSRFALSRHAWDAPMSELARESEGRRYSLWTPMIGETFSLDGGGDFSAWWDLV